MLLKSGIPFHYYDLVDGTSKFRIAISDCTLTIKVHEGINFCEFLLNPNGLPFGYTFTFKIPRSVEEAKDCFEIIEKWWSAVKRLHKK